MEFCKNCRNMLYIISSEKTLQKNCKHCNTTDIIESENAIKLSETIYSNDELLFQQNCNNYIREDPTLRRVQDPNVNNGKPTIYIKYNPKDMNYMYVCPETNKIWKN